MIPKARNPVTVTLLALLIAICSSSHGAEDLAVKPNVVLILADDLGYGGLSCYGQKAYRTPAIDRLATEGVRATNYYVPVPYCAPSRASLLTGRFPLRHGMIHNPHPDTTPEANEVFLSHDELTMGEVYQRSGYKTAMIGKWHLGHKEKAYYPTRRGFDSYYGILYSNDMLPIRIMANEEVAVYPLDQRTITTRYTEKAIEFIKGNDGSPFFLYLAHTMPHTPLAVSDKHYTPDTPDDLYHDVIRELDWSVSEVIKTLESKGVLENTIVIFASDNGPHYGGDTGGLKGKKATPWEGGTRVPFIIRYPSKFPPNKVVTTPIWALDLFPTLLNLCGIESPQDRKIDGENIVKLLQGKTNKHAPIFTSHREKVITIRDGDWKLYLHKPHYLSKRDLNPDWIDPKAPNGTSIIAQSEQPSSMKYPGVVPKKFDNPLPLFNLAQDPTESIDRSKEYPELATKLRKQYQRFLATMPPLKD
ncbi:MAG: sulfatase-like hydrolase/transferase [Akkermansiaceae bacterium]